MRLVAKLLICILIFSFIAHVEGQNSANSNSDPVSINYVSTDANSISSTLTGSYGGGTAVYIQGVGFDATFENNVIYIGSNICSTTAKGVTQTSIVCYTSAYVSGQLTSNLPITIQVLNKQPYTCSTSACLFSYTNTQTPSLYAVYPRASSANQWINFYGVHRITDLGDGRDMGDIVGFYIGDSLCTRFDIEQAAITSNANQFISCSVVPTQEGGYYNIKEWVTPGIALENIRMNYGSVLNNALEYQFIVSPAITGLSSHTGGSQGNELTISGTGFSIEPNNISVTVANIPCAVTSASSTSIQCTVGADTPGNTYGLLATNSTSQNNGYVAGTGFTYARYNTTSLSSQTIASFRTNIQNPSEQVKQIPYDEQNTPTILGELESPALYSDYLYGEFLSGYFIAPTTGNYVFRGLADDTLEVYISNVTGSQEGINYANPILKSTQYSQSNSYSNYYVANYASLTSSPIAMTAGDAYYMEVYHLNTAGTGYFKVSVQVPNNNTAYPNQVYEVQQLAITPNVVPEILEYNVTGANHGTIFYKIAVVDSKTLATTYSANATLNYNATATQFQNMLNSFTNFYGYYPSVVLTTYDINGVATALSGGAAYTYNYRATLQLYRPTTYSATNTSYTFKYDFTNASNTVNTSTIPSVSYAQVQQHSDPVAGTFTFTLGGVTLGSNGSATNIPYNIDAATLTSYIITGFGYKGLEIDIAGNGSVNGNTYILSFVGANQDIPQVTIDASGLTGGAVTTPSVVVSTLREYSTNLLVEPVTTEFLGIPALAPEVIVHVGGAVSRCLDDCSYTVDATLTPVLNAASLTNNVLTLNITTPAGTPPFVVTLDGQTCTYTSGTAEAYQCTLPVNNNNNSSPVLETGSHLPSVYIEGNGYADNTGSNLNIDWDLTATSLSASTGYIYGGATLTLTGLGFPLSSSETYTLQQCGQSVDVLSVSNTAISFISSPCAEGDANVSLTFNGQTVSLPYVYASPSGAFPTITGITPNTYSPVLKGFMNITGTNFGTNLSEYTVWLNNGSNIYQLNVLDVSDTNLYVRIPGGQAGVFDVLVQRSGFGYALVEPTTANDFTYGIFVNSISPTTGSINGGTIITITGSNFSPVLKENQVYLGDNINWNCLIITATANTITCTAPAIATNYGLTNPITVVGRAMVDSECVGNCSFTYDNSTYPTVSIGTLTSSYTAGQNVTLSGSNLVNNGVQPVVYVGTAVATIVASSNNSVTFTYPALANGSYVLNVYVDGLGYASPSYTTVTLLAPTGISPTNGSYVGNTVYIVGSGLVDTDNVYLTFKATISTNSSAFSYNVRSDNTPSKFGIDFIGCSDGATITLSYQYQAKTTAYTFNYKCVEHLTPAITLLSAKTLPYNAVSQDLVFNRTLYPNVVPDYLLAYPVDANNARFGADITLSLVSAVRPNITVSGTPLTTGRYAFKFVYNGTNKYGTSFIADYLNITSATAPTIAADVNSSYTGGAHISVTGEGLSTFAALTVAGVPATIIPSLSSPSNLVYSAPALVTALSQSSYDLVKEQVLTGTVYSDTAANAKNAFDGLVSTLYSSSLSTCYIGLDFGQYQQAAITKIRFYPNPTWKSAIPYIKGANISGSNDGTTWTLLNTLDSTVHTGWNIWKPESALTQTYRYVRFQHNSTSGCNLAEFEVSGYLYAGSIASLSSNSRLISLNNGLTSTTTTQNVVYKSELTPLVTEISPRYGSPVGGTNLTINGTGFGTSSSDVTVTIDGIACAVVSVADTVIVCTTGARDEYPSAFSFVVTVSGNIAAVSADNFMYVYRWSDTLTWGGDLAPIDGDAVYVPVGMTLLVDVTTPNLYLLLVEGTIIFADESDIVVESTFIIIENGVFQAGTETNPYQNQLTFILHGDYYDTQLPGFGNKVIGCHECTFDMHGQTRNVTWTELDQTVNAGESIIYLTTPVDWQVGENIVIASSSFEHSESEQRTITAISADRIEITLNQSLNYMHLAVEETHGTDKISMRSEVGLISRNIKVQGDSTSVAKNYGAHVMMHGSAKDGLVGRIAYSEFTHCGQPAIVGRYCIHFHMNGDVSDSYVRGNAVHHSFARVLTLHAVYYLTVEYNVGYWVRGHNIFLEDGIEQYNVIQYNLMISSLQVFNMLQTDISVASYWVTNPLNTLRYNHAAGSDFYGVWYEIKTHPDGPSATTDICPTGLPLGESHDNVAHSNVRFGLRVFELFSSQNPCNPIRNDGAEDPWAANPSIQNVFENYVLWRNGEDGLLGERIGNTIFRNITVADSIRAGVEFYKTNYTRENAILENVAIIGQSNFNPSDYNNYSGLITSRTDGSEYNNIRFYNFPPESTIISVGSKNEQMLLRATGGKSYFFSNISVTNYTGNFLHYIYTRRYTLYDTDGSLSYYVDNTTRSSATITPYYEHNEITGSCANATNQTKWNGSLICSPGVVVNNLDFGAGQPASMFFGSQMFVKRLDTNSQNITTADTGIANTWVYKTDAEQKNTWSFPFVSGHTYSVWWSTGIDWTSITADPSFYFDQADDGFIIRFNYTTHRELFDIGHLIAGSLQIPLVTPQSAQLDYSTCNYGDYYLDTELQFLFVCISGKGKSTYDLLNLNGIPCRYLCAKEGGGFTKENFVRVWSNTSQWQGGVLPPAGANITVNGNWTILMDVDVTNLNNITIDGDVFLTDANRALSANFIWIRFGSLNAGNATIPFQYNFTITLNGQKSARTYTIDEITSLNKYIVVSGALNLYGKVPAVTSTKLTSIAAAGATSINVISTSGWAVGNTIGIAPSWNNAYEYESVTITALTSTSVTFTPALNFSHYGEAYPFNNSYGTIDQRAAVGVFDRNIKILSGADQNGWGYGVLIYAWVDSDNFINTGTGIIQGVEFVTGGQYDTLNAAFNVINTNAGNENTIVSGSSFHYCHDYCVYLSNANNLTINNNYFFVGQKFIAYAENVYQYNFTNNVLTGARNRSSMEGSFTGDDIACYSQYTALDWTTDNNYVQNNLCQGSGGTGFNFPHTPCNYLGSGLGFINNVAGTTQVGFLLSGPMDCAGGEGLRAYASKAGVVTNPKAKSFVWNNLMFADCTRGLGLRFGGNDQANNSMFVYNTYITPVSRPNCTTCYQAGATSCSNLRGIRLLANSENTEVLPKTFGDSFQVICKAELFDSNAWLYNVTFENFKINYTGVIASLCKNNQLFESHPIDDSNIGNHHFYNSTCTNCDRSAFGHCDPPIESHLGWFGGCGNFPCSGRSNYLIHDHSGTLLGFQGVIIPNNTAIGTNTANCVYDSVMNGHICNRTDFARLKYTSIASDFKSRIMWPVNLTFEGGSWTTSTNGWREWGWDGDEPLNTRMGRFLSVVQLYKIYNMSFESQPPTDMLFSFSLPTLAGNNSQWIGVKIYYPIPNAITVTLSNGSTTKSIISTDTDNITNYVDRCGTNKYFYKNNTIHFIVTADAQCTVRVTLSSSVQITARLSVDINTFYDSNGLVNFVDQMCAFLGITTDRLKIVGVYSGSTIVDSVITPTLSSTDDASSVVPNSAATVADLQALAAKISSASSSDLAGLPNFVGASATVNIMNANGEVVNTNTTPTTSETSDNTKFIIIGVVVGVVGAILIGISIYLIVKKLRKRNAIVPEESPSHFGEEASKDVIRAENRSEFELKPIDCEPEQMSRVHPQ